MQKKRSKSRRKPKSKNKGSGAKHPSHSSETSSSSSSSSGSSSTKSGDSRKRGPKPNSKYFGKGAPKKVHRIKVERTDEHKQATDTILQSWKRKSEELRNLPLAPDDKLDDWQRDVLDSLEAGLSIVVDAPTSAGKTRAVELFFKRHLKNPKFRVAYTTPVKSLSNDKYRELSAKFGSENVGIATGDVKENLNAPIVVATLECYRNSLLGVDPDLGRTMVVFDEYHYIQDPGRGTSWEEAIILTPKNCQLLLLSASVKNAEQFKGWICKIRESEHACKLVATYERPVPLENLIWHHDNWYDASTFSERVTAKNKRAKWTPKPDADYKLFAQRMAGAAELGLTPTLAYCGKRADCENMYKLLSRQLGPMKSERQKQIKETLAELEQQRPFESLAPKQLLQNIRLFGVAYHHSGLPPTVRYAIELLLKKGLLRFCSATMGLSLGINFAVRSAMICDGQRPGQNGMEVYPESEVLQMLGRAGRRGSDAVGFCLWPDLEAFQKFGHSKREDCFTNVRNDPTTFLGLLSRGFDLQEMEFFYENSFSTYLRRDSNGGRVELIHPTRVKKYLRTDSLPCSSPAQAFAEHSLEEKSPCYSCKNMVKCHKLQKQVQKQDAGLLQHHLYRIRAVGEDDKLTKYGELARFFPQNGGLVLARILCDGQIQADNLDNVLQLIACLATARFKAVQAPQRYQFPFDLETLEDSLESYYPLELFPELYDPPWGRRRHFQLKEFNPLAGFALDSWHRRDWTWEKLVSLVCSEKFGQGDLMGMFTRSSTYLQSLASAVEDPAWKSTLKDTRSRILRAPLDLGF